MVWSLFLIKNAFGSKWLPIKLLGSTNFLLESGFLPREGDVCTGLLRSLNNLKSIDNSLFFDYFSPFAGSLRSK